MTLLVKAAAAVVFVLLVHEDVHGRPHVAKEVIELRQYQARNIACPRPV